MQCKCYLKSLWPINYFSSFSFWSFLELLFLNFLNIFSLQLVEVASVMHLDHASEPASHYVSCIAGGFFSTSAAWEAQHAYNWHKKTYIYWLKRRMSPIVYIPSVSPLPWHPCSMYSLLWEAGPDPNSLHPQLPLPSDFCWHRPMGQCTDLFSTHCPYLCK